ncbi:hypothetical protein BS78_08G066400 [Paspalum vaginatum]|uniref:Uncharacterized protein n=1 Tax=Paspalum vaginatum TaxID=158149 RepID=A0A9W7X9B9_9POAL|nr:hypothetical protein BS78_K164600 [Paspalum vaginatum]KAJ1255750.1 hypothetical protein BS78_K164600 [Paspalum vaginatum]KAJ1265282.1 hypothetical protein BS78_08G066400 [Paspalum vaginatum]KAJ1265283.1 hypothetical protein BS78_08G066400 [Paspalum vaginatum]
MERRRAKMPEALSDGVGLLLAGPNGCSTKCHARALCPGWPCTPERAGPIRAHALDSSWLALATCMLLYLEIGSTRTGLKDQSWKVSFTKQTMIIQALYICIILPTCCCCPIKAGSSIIQRSSSSCQPFVCRCRLVLPSSFGHTVIVTPSVTANIIVV